MKFNNYLRHSFTIICLCGISIVGYSQVSFSIRHVTVSNVKPPFNDIESRSDIEDGPVVLFLCEIVNESDKILELFPSKGSYRLSFKYDNENFTQNIYPLAFMRIDRIKLQPKEKKEFTVVSKIFLGTPIYESKKDDYSYEMIQSLPTVKITYIDMVTNITLVSTQIENVKLNPY